MVGIAKNKVSVANTNSQNQTQFNRLITNWPGIVALILIIIDGLFFAFSIPIGGGFDEPMHIARAAQISHGIINPVVVQPNRIDTSLVSFASDRDTGYGGDEDMALYKISVLGNRSFFNNNRDNSSWNPYSFPAVLDSRVRTNEKMGKGTVTWLFSNTSINSPISYVPYSIAYGISSHLTNDPLIVGLAMRLSGLFSFALAIFYLIRLIPHGKWVLAFLSVCPQSIADISVVTADTMTFIAVATFLTFVLRLIDYGSKDLLDWAGISIGTFMICLTKTTYAPFGLLLLIVPAFNAELRNIKSIAVLLLIGLISILFFCLWYFTIHNINTGLLWNAEINPKEQVLLVKDRPIFALYACIRGLMTADIFALTYPTFTSGRVNYVPQLVVLLIVLYHEINSSKQITIKNRYGFFITCLLAVALMINLLIAFALYVQFTPPGYDSVLGLQTRYFLPTALVILIGLASLGHYLSASEKERIAPFESLGRVVLTAAFLLMDVILVICYISIYYI